MGLNTKYAELYFETVSFPTVVNNTVADNSYSHTHTLTHTHSGHTPSCHTLNYRASYRSTSVGWFQLKKTCLEYNTATPLHNENAGPPSDWGGGATLSWSCMHWLIFPPLVRKVNEKSIKHLSFISLCRSTDPSQGVMVWDSLCSSACCGTTDKNTQTHTHTHRDKTHTQGQTHTHTGCRLKYQKVSRQARGETGVAGRQAGPPSSLSLSVCLCGIKDATGNCKQGTASVFGHAYCRCQMCLPIPFFGSQSSFSHRHLKAKKKKKKCNYGIAMAEIIWKKMLKPLSESAFYQWKSFDYTYFWINDARPEPTAKDLITYSWMCVACAFKKKTTCN